MNNGMDLKMMRKKQFKAVRKSWLWVVLAAVAAFIVLRFFPDKQAGALNFSWQFFLEMFWVLPAVMLLIGLINVWVSNEMVVKYLGKKSGFKGVLLSIIFGSLPTGPLYLAFPIATTLTEKGASVSNIIIFLSAWACIKLPQEMVELQFLGLSFTVLRLVLTVVLVILMGYLIQWLIERRDRKEKSENR